MFEVESLDISSARRGQVGVDGRTLTFYRRQITIELTKKEAAMVICMLEHFPGRASKVDLLVSIGWNEQSVTTTHTISSHINRIRKKLADRMVYDFILSEGSEYWINWS